ncbi:MAG: hypothetical protein Aurels2KO_12350 [Aureliella sp.]
MHKPILYSPALFAFLVAQFAHGFTPADKDADFAAANKVLNRYCAGCHNASEPEGDFSVADFSSLMKGTPDGSVVKAGKPDESLLLKLVTGDAEPVMPPEDEDQPSAEEIDILRRWIANGATGPAATGGSAMLPTRPEAPQIEPAKQQFVTAIAAMPAGKIATATLGRVTVTNRKSSETIWTIDDLPGKVNSLRLSDDKQWLVIGSGVTGTAGSVTIASLKDGSIKHQITGHTDAIYCANLSPDNALLATGSYDRTVILWKLNETQPEQIHTFTGHNGAIYDLDFSPDGSVLATASADQTIKLWNTQQLQRLDTLGQPEGEMRCVRISNDGEYVFGAGGDRQIRKWQLVSTTKPAINPMVFARYAHEKGIGQLTLVGDHYVATASDDKTVKLWHADDLSVAAKPQKLNDIPSGIAALPPHRCVAVELTGKRSLINFSVQPIATKQRNSQAPTKQIASSNRNKPSLEKLNFAESEPNDRPGRATAITLPAVVEGNIELASNGRGGEDLFRFPASAGEAWIFDVSTPKESELDSWIEVVDSQGKNVLNTRLQALRESYFTFRGKDSDTSDDFRLHKWEDMELDEYLYSSGEVTRLWLYPRGPDSGFKVYPGRGKRETFFGTTPVTHALGETAYVVRPLADEEPPLPNGLPVFPIYFENDDDPLRRDGKDSRLEFVAPASGDYILRVRDARAFGGEKFAYSIDIRQPNPDFKLSIQETDLKMPVGAGREWVVNATRLDGLDAAISVNIEGLPEGFRATNPVIIEAGQTQARGTIFATPAAREALAITEDERTSGEADEEQGPDAEKPKYKTVHLHLTATAEVNGRTISHEIEKPISVTITESKEVLFRLVASDDPNREIEELTIQPGQTVTARIIIKRNGVKGPISFGKDDAGRNLPHGAFVDNIGLNGLLIPDGQTEREFFITAAPKLRPGSRQFHLRTEQSGKSTSWPLWLRVVQPETLAGNQD